MTSEKIIPADAVLATFVECNLVMVNILIPLFYFCNLLNFLNKFCTLSGI